DSYDIGYGIGVDSAGNAYVAGRTLSTNFPTASPFQPTHGGAQDAFVTKISESNGPNLMVTPASLTFTHQIGSPFPAAQSVSVSSTGAALSFTAAASTTSGGNWLSVSPASATTPAALAVSVNPAGLATGTYSGAITLTSPAAGNSPQTVAITLTVSTQANLTRTPALLTFTNQIGLPPPASQSVSVSST